MPHSGRTGKTASLNAKIKLINKSVYRSKTEKKEKKNENRKEHKNHSSCHPFHYQA
jgi:hypothetical protein